MKRFKSFLKISAFVSIIAFFSMLTWSNWSPSTHTEKNIPNDTKFEMFNFRGKMENGKIKQAKFLNIEGINSCSLNEKNNVIGIIYRTGIFDSEQLTDKLTRVFAVNFESKNCISTKAGCPVTGTKYFILAIKRALRFRS